MNVTVFGKKVFADIIKDLKIILDYLVGRALNPVTSALISDTQRREAQRRENGPRGEGNVKTEAEMRIHSDNPRSTWTHQELEEVRKDSPSASGGRKVLLTLIWGS